jgi:hypothetical protein
VRRWPTAGLDAAVSVITIARVYRLLRAVLNSTAHDGLIPRNRCRIKSASVEESPELPVLTAREVLDLAATIDPRYQVLVPPAVSRRCAGGTGSASAQRHQSQCAHRHGVRTLTGAICGGQVSGRPRLLPGSTPSPFTSKQAGRGQSLTLPGTAASIRGFDSGETG